MLASRTRVPSNPEALQQSSVKPMASPTFKPQRTFQRSGYFARLAFFEGQLVPAESGTPPKTLGAFGKHPKKGEGLNWKRWDMNHMNVQSPTLQVTEDRNSHLFQLNRCFYISIYSEWDPVSAHQAADQSPSFHLDPGDGLDWSFGIAACSSSAKLVTNSQLAWTINKMSPSFLGVLKW